MWAHVVSAILGALPGGAALVFLWRYERRTRREMNQLAHRLDIMEGRRFDDVRADV